MAEEEQRVDEQFEIPRMTDEELKAFVRDLVGGRLFSSFHLAVDEPPETLMRVFLPLALGSFLAMPEEQLGQVACLWQHLSESSPLSIGSRCSGMLPTFWSFRAMHVDDWERVLPTIQKLLNVELKPAVKEVIDVPGE